MERTDITGINLKELELNALLEVTQAINNNLPEESLYKIYRFTLLANLNVKKLALFVFDEEWDCKVNFGVKHEYESDDFPSEFTNLEEAVRLNGDLEGFEEFDIAIPVLHKTRLLAVVFVGDLQHERFGPALDSATTFLEALTNIILVAIENKKLARKELEQEAFKKELEIAKQVQQFLFPKELPELPNLKIASRYLPHKDVGGDYYDYIELSPDKFMLCIADVSGKGVPAALMMSNFQASLRTLVRKTNDLKEIVEDLNFQINFSGNAEIFITFFIALYDAKNHILEYINCGHNPPLLCSESGEVTLLDKGTTVLGMFCPLPFNTLGTYMNLRKFTLFCYTDGLTEVVNDEEEEYGPDRLNDMFGSCVDMDPDKVNQRVLHEVDAFRSGNSYRDDVTLLTCRVEIIEVC